MFGATSLAGVCLRRGAGLLAAVALLVAVAGCATARLSSANYDKIQNGMSRGEVAALIGEPDGAIVGNLMGMAGGGAYWRESDTTVVIQFVDDKVVGKQMVKGSLPGSGLLGW